MKEKVCGLQLRYLFLIKTVRTKIFRLMFFDATLHAKHRLPIFSEALISKNSKKENREIKGRERENVR